MSFIIDNPKLEEAKRLAREKINGNIENRRESLSNSAIFSKKRNSLVSTTPIRNKPKINKLVASAPPKSQSHTETTQSDNLSELVEEPSMITEDFINDDISPLEMEEEKESEILPPEKTNDSELIEQNADKIVEDENKDEDNEDYIPESEEDDDDSIFNELEEISPEEVYELQKDAYIYKQVVGENKPLDKQFLMYASIISSIIIVLCILWMKLVS